MTRLLLVRCLCSCSLHAPFPVDASVSGIDALLSGCSISIHPPFLVKCTFWPIPRICSLFSASSASMPLLLDRELAGHGRIVDADNETVRIDAAKVAMKNVDVASRRVRSEGLESGRSADHIFESLERWCELGLWREELQREGWRLGSRVGGAVERATVHLEEGDADCAEPSKDVVVSRRCCSERLRGCDRAGLSG